MEPHLGASASSPGVPGDVALIGQHGLVGADDDPEHPELTRLLLWEGLLDLPEVPDEDSRTAYYRTKVAAFTRAQQTHLISDDMSGPDLAFLILALAGWWYAVPQMARMMHADDPATQETAREALMRAAMKLATPTSL
ncbi:hypothetical protein [Nonomuraea sp. B5E05]|uniref:hypothetical protein n=1 Tax=Nonomuraea sp. B5E05 TaxID=3153569 RepID=UPI0032605A4C